MSSIPSFPERGEYALNWQQQTAQHLRNALHTLAQDMDMTDEVTMEIKGQWMGVVYWLADFTAKMEATAQEDAEAVKVGGYKK
ncbi:hypothetical protein Geu3261_0079_006 [Komagataeibacter europaeus NBRC 3261]|uniref:Uncharacterized protein n=1 Tax=Komagataeibacter europaeus NBRC 3261 TaxID=1234669 RepID=A0A0D6Q197_KOMEU|nr:hypothetical protein [Komagataeibacter europaeus]GAN96556.1 hypothetical protein Geu3261_0079_006 [Komagataeibacter europaeus NBRC 3261]